jgi:hypothetical protein
MQLFVALCVMFHHVDKIVQTSFASIFLDVKNRGLCPFQKWSITLFRLCQVLYTGLIWVTNVCPNPEEQSILCRIEVGLLPNFLQS